MATIAVLNTVFSATTDKFSAGTKAAQRDLSSFERAVDKLQKKLFSLEGAFKLGTGVGLGNEVVSRIHQGISRAVGALSDGVQAGQSFTSTLEDAAKAAFGMETGLAQAKKRATEYHAVLGKIREAQHLADTEAGKESTLTALQDAAKKAREAAAPGLEAINKARIFADMPSSAAHGQQSVRQFQLEEVKKKWGNQLALLDIAEQRLGDYIRSQEKIRQQAEAMGHAWSQLRANFMGGAATGPNGTVWKSGMLPNAAANFQNSAAGVIGPIANLGRVIGDAVGKAAVGGAGMARTKEEQEALKERQAMIERIQRETMSPLEKFNNQRRMLEDLLAKGDITQSQFNLAKQKELATLAATLPDPNRRAGLAEFGSQAAFAAMADTPQHRTEKQILDQAEQQTEYQRIIAEGAAKNGVVVATF